MILQLSENRSTLRKIYEEREKSFQGLGINNHDFEEKSDHYRAIMAVFLSGYYGNVVKNSWCFSQK